MRVRRSLVRIAGVLAAVAAAGCLWPAAVGAQGADGVSVPQVVIGLNSTRGDDITVDVFDDYGDGGPLAGSIARAVVESLGPLPDGPDYFDDGWGTVTVDFDNRLGRLHDGQLRFSWDTAPLESRLAGLGVPEVDVVVCRPDLPGRIEGSLPPDGRSGSCAAWYLPAAGGLTIEATAAADPGRYWPLVVTAAAAAALLSVVAFGLGRLVRARLIHQLDGRAVVGAITGIAASGGGFVIAAAVIVAAAGRVIAHFVVGLDLTDVHQLAAVTGPAALLVAPGLVFSLCCVRAPAMAPSVATGRGGGPPPHTPDGGGPRLPAWLEEDAR